MSIAEDANFYLVKGIVIGGNKTGKSTFLRQMEKGSPVDTRVVQSVFYKNYDRIGGKLRVKV